MNTYLLLAACLTILIGFVHSVLGERLIFTKLRQQSVAPNLPAGPLKLKKVRILWATWHLASVFGLAIAAVLLNLARYSIDVFIIHAIAIAMLFSAAFVFWASGGKHPAWLGLTGVALLCWLGL